MKRLLPPLMIVLIAVAIFAPIVGHDFTDLDDSQTIALNNDLCPPTIDGLKHIWSDPAAGLYVPMTYSVWWLVAQIGFYNGILHPWPFHLLGMMLHAGNGLLVWLILRQLQFSLLSSLIGALVFVVHPMQVETVAWASGAKDQLAAFFSLCAIAAYFRNSFHSRCTRGGRESFPTIPSPGNTNASSKSEGSLPIPLPAYREREAVAWFPIALMTLAMLAKPSAITTPLVILAMDWIYYRRSLRRAFRRLWPIAFALVPAAIIARSVQTIWPAVITPLWQRPLIASDALAFYLVKLIWPATLTHLYGRTPMLVGSSRTLYWSWLLPTFTGLLVLSQLRRRPRLTAGVTVVVLALLPVLGLTPFEFQIHSTVADHYLYFAMFGVAMVVAEIAEGLGTWDWRLGRGDSATRQTSDPFRRAHGTLSLIAIAALLLALAVRSAFQIPVWKNSLTLQQHAVAVRPQSVDAHGSLAIALAEAGQPAAAVPHLRFVVAHVPDNRMGHLRLTEALMSLGQFDRALPEAVAAVRLTSRVDHDPLPNRLLGEILIALHRREEAAAALEAAHQIDPADVEVLRLIETLHAPSTQSVP